MNKNSPEPPFYLFFWGGQAREREKLPYRRIRRVQCPNVKRNANFVGSGGFWGEPFRRIVHVKCSNVW